MNILVVCAAGMSSSALVQKMRTRISERGLEDMKVGSCASFELGTYAVQADVILFAPQLSFMTEKENTYQARIIVLNREEYGLQDADSVIERILHPENEKKNNTFATDLRVLHEIAGWMKTNPVITSITEGMMNMLPVSVAGGLLSLLQNLPIPGYAEMIRDSGITNLLSLGYDMTLGTVSVYLCAMIAAAYAKRKKMKPAPMILGSMIIFLLFVSNPDSGTIDMTYFGARGMLSAIITTVAVCIIYKLIERNSGRKEDLEGIPENVRNSFISLLPLLFCIIIGLVIVASVRMLGHDSPTAMVEKYIQSGLVRFAGSSVVSYIIMSLLTSVLWFFGIHGGHIIATITDPVYLSLSLENIAAFQSDKVMPNIINSGLGSAFIFGGIGSTLALSMLCAFRARSQKLKTVGKISLPMGIFFINEPVLFGIPIILNPFLFLPFLFIPIISGILTVLLMKGGILPYTVGFQIPWTTPPVLSGFIQGGWRLALWQVIVLGLQTVMWYPFFRVIDRRELENENSRS